MPVSLEEEVVSPEHYLKYIFVSLQPQILSYSLKKINLVTIINHKNDNLLENNL